MFCFFIQDQNQTFQVRIFKTKDDFLKYNEENCEICLLFKFPNFTFMNIENQTFISCDRKKDFLFKVHINQIINLWSKSYKTFDESRKEMNLGRFDAIIKFIPIWAHFKSWSKCFKFKTWNLINWIMKKSFLKLNPVQARFCWNQIFPQKWKKYSINLRNTSFIEGITFRLHPETSFLDQID